MKALVIINPFDAYSRGEQITNAETIADILSGDHSGHVISISVADEQPADIEAPAAPVIEQDEEGTAA